MPPTYSVPPGACPRSCTTAPVCVFPPAPFPRTIKSRCHGKATPEAGSTCRSELCRAENMCPRKGERSPEGPLKRRGGRAHTGSVHRGGGMAVAGGDKKRRRPKRRAPWVFWVQRDDKPGYVVGDHLSRPAVAGRLEQPTCDWTGRPLSRFGLASDGVYMCPARYRAGGSLLHCPSTLTRPEPGGIFLLHCPGSRLRRPLAGILPCEARTFLTCSFRAVRPMASLHASQPRSPVPLQARL